MSSRWSVIGLSLLLSAWCAAQSRLAPPPPSVYNEQNPLPAGMTPEEQRMPLPTVPPGFRAPPTGFVHTPAEYEPMDGLFIAWEGFTNILTQIADYATEDPAVTVYCVVDSVSEQTTAYNALNAGGVNMSQVEFIVRTTDSVWIRDYGPRFIFEDGFRTFVDHTYNRPSRPNDDAFNDYLSTLWGIPHYDIPLVHGGGNFHLFANGDAFMTTLIQTENPGLSAADIIQLFADYENVNLTIFPAFPTSYDSTQHIDMWMLPLGDFKVIIGQYPPSSGQPYTITENAVTSLQARGYTVYRTPGWNSGGTHYTYTNAVILNNQCMISRFNVGQDAQALAVFQQALPGYTIRQIDCTSIIGSAGALHCIVMHVPEESPIPSVAVSAPDGGETWYVGSTHDITWTATDSGGVTGIDLYYSTDGGLTFPYTLATGEENDGVFTWTIPDTPSYTCRVRVVAHDADGNTGEDVSAGDFTINYAPQPIHTFPLDTNPGWTADTGWAFGAPTGGGSHNRDPLAGHTGANVYGYNLAGDYTNNMPARYLTTTALDCAAATEVELRFWRWLGVESTDHATLEVSANGVVWTPIWSNTTTINENAWSLQTYDISAVADGQATVYIRWGLGPTDGSVTYPGWNIDDVELWGVVPPNNPTPGDLNCDGEINFGDINAFVLRLTNPAGWQATYPDCNPLNGDINGNGTVGFDDINPFVQLLTGL